MYNTVAVCVATFRRPKQLAQLLDSLKDLVFNNIEAPRVCVLVADNDAAGTAEEICRAFSPTFPWELRYFIHPARGLSQIRNRLIKEALNVNAQYAAFIDDDEVAAPAWLEALLTAGREFKADVVQGTVHPVFAQTPPSWIIHGSFFDRPIHKTGEASTITMAGNVLVKVSMMTTLGGFDDYFSFTGGEDTDLFMRAEEAGYSLRYCHEAVVHEIVPWERTNARYLLLRAFRTGNTWALCRMRRDARLIRRLGLVIKAFLLIAVGIAGSAAIVLGRHRLMHMWCRAARGMGLVYGVCGLKYEPYR